MTELTPTPPAPTPNPDNVPPVESTPDDKSFTQADIDKAISERLKREKDASEKRIAETLRKEREEWERQSKLSEEQRAEEQRKQMESELSEKERNLALRENRADARELLIERGIDSTLVDFVVDVDADKTKDNVNQLEKAYAQAVKAGVDKALAGTTPKDTSSEQRVETQQYGNTTVI